MSGITCSTCRYYKHISKRDYCFKKNKFLSSLDEARTCDYYTPKHADNKEIIEVKGREIGFSEKHEEELGIIRKGKEKEKNERGFLPLKKERTKIWRNLKLNKVAESRIINAAIENKKAFILVIFFIIVILLILRK